MSERKTLKDMTSTQCLVYNDMTDVFVRACVKYIQTYPNPDQRFGQTFYNYYPKVFHFQPCPELFYEEDNVKAGKLIVHYLVTYIMENYK